MNDWKGHGNTGISMLSRNLKIVLFTVFILSLSACKLPNFDLELAETLGGVPSDTYTYTVTFNDQGAETSANPQTKTVIPPAKTIDTLPSEPLRGGYVFGGWWTETAGGGNQFTAATIVKADITVYAKWTALPTYTVTYNGNGADGGIAPQALNSYMAGETVVVLGNSGSPALFKAGHTFIGWNTRADGSGTERIPGTTFTMPAENLTLYAVWTTEPTYSVIYNGNGSSAGSPPADGNNYLSGQTVTVLPKPEDLRGAAIQDGITQRFVEWNTQDDGMGTSYAAGSTFPMPAGGITLFAIWTDDPTVLRKIGPAGGLVFLDKGSITDGWRYMEAAPAEAEAASVQWGSYGTMLNVTENSLGTGRHNTNTIAAALEGFETGRAAQTAFELSYNGYSDWFLPAIDELEVIYNELKTVGLGGFGDGVYWSSTESDGTNSYGFNFISSNSLASSKNTAYSVRAVRAFSGTEETYTVFYHGNGAAGGSAPEDHYFYETGEEVVVKDFGTLTNGILLLDGWNTQADGNGIDYNPAETFFMPAEDVILYAKWVMPNQYYVYYNENGAASGDVPVDSNPYLESDIVTVLDNTGGLARPGYTFTGWNTQADGLGSERLPGSSFAMPAVNVTLYAQWTDNPTFTVSYNGNGSSAGSPPVDSNSYVAGPTVTVLPKPADLRGPVIQNGITQRFIAWNTQADGLGNSYDPGDYFTMPAENVTLYAIWTNDPTVLRKIGPAGGLVFLDKGSITDGWRYMEAAPAEAEAASVQWGSYGTMLNVTENSLGTGRHNTNTIAAALEGFETGRAAQTAFELSYNGYSDWFLPAIDELEVIYNELKTVGLGGFGDGVYWSSTESDGTNSYGFNFISSNSLASSKNTAYSVRAVRAFRNEAQTYSILYRKNGATGGNIPADFVIYHSGDTFFAAAYTGGFIRTGYNFTDWNTQAGGGGDSYSPGNNHPFPGAADLVLYAQWEPLFAGGSGVDGDPFLVATPEHLDNVRLYPDAYFEQTADIDLNVAPYNTGAGWIPIKPFGGQYAGDGHTISNLYINSFDNNVGLFGVVDSAPIDQLLSIHIIDPNVTNAGQNTGALAGSVSQVSIIGCSVLGGTVEGAANTGGLVGHFTGVIEDSFSTAFVQGSDSVGGLVGYADYGLISRSFSQGEVALSALSGSSGGFIGTCASTITVENCYATGDVTGGQSGSITGGFVGTYLAGSITNCYSAGLVTSSGGVEGGFVGLSSPVVTDCYYDTNTSGQSDNNANSQPLTTEEMRRHESFPSWDLFTIWDVETDVSYPYLQWQPGLYPVP